LPNIDFLHVFGCSVFIHNHKDHLGKFNEKADDGYFLGYSLVSKAFRVFNIRRQQTEETYHITFDESTDPIKFTKPLVDNITIAKSKRYPPNEYLHPYKPSQRYQVNSNDISFIEPYEEPEPVVLKTNVSLDQNDQTDHSTQVYEILNDDQPEHLNNNSDEPIIENLLNTKDVQTSKTLSSPAEDALVSNTNPIPTNPSLSIPSMASSGPQYKWYQDKHIKQVNIIGNQGAGMLTRAMAKELSAASAHECFESSEFLNHVCKLDKALYGLKQAPRAWYLKDGCNMGTRKKHFRGLSIARGKLVCWNAKKQQFVAMSSAEAEYVAAAGCCVNILWMKSQLTNYDIIYEKVPIFCDNTSAIAISNNPVLHSKTKHIDIKYHFIIDHILKGDIELHFIPTQYQLANIFTKPLD
ncbi:retrovirus-related pol polyprotein from transposon TNT 1-94, partial [Tanacetum coccineum]